MTRQIDPAKPPTHTTGSEHYRAAEKLLAQAQTAYETETGHPTQLAAMAAVHAQLAAAAPIEPLTIALEPWDRSEWARIEQQRATLDAVQPFTEHTAPGSFIPVGADAVAAVDELVDAIRLTVEYIGLESLPAYPGWSWYDALRKHRPEIAAEFVSRQERNQAAADTAAMPAGQPSVWDDADEHPMQAPPTQSETDVATAIRVLEHVREDLLTLTPAIHEAFGRTLYVLRDLLDDDDSVKEQGGRL